MALNPVWANELYIGTARTLDGWTYARLREGVESIEFSPNEQNQQYFFLDGHGFAHNETTGAAPSVVVSGRRVAGDAAQEFIAGRQFGLGADRATSVKIVAEGRQIVCDATLGEVTGFGGKALDVNAFGCRIHLNGRPVVTAAE